MIFIALLDHRSVLADLHDSDLALACERVQSIAWLLLRERPRLALIGEHDVHITVHQIVEEGLVGLNYIV